MQPTLQAICTIVRIAKLRGAAAFGRRLPQLWNYKHGILRLVILAANGLYTAYVQLDTASMLANYVWPSVPISGSIKLSIVTPSSDLLRLNQLSSTG